MDRGPARPGRDLQPGRLAAVRHDGVAAQGARRAARAGPGPDRRRLHRDVQRAARPGARHRAGRPAHHLPAPHLDPRRRQPRRAARPRGGGGDRVDHPLGRLGRHAAPRQGRQPQQRAAGHRGRVPAHPRRRHGPRARDPGPDAGLLLRRADGAGPDPAVLRQRPRRRPARQPGAAVLRADPGGQGRLERRVLLRLQRRHPPRGAHAARRLAVRRRGRGRRAPRAADRPLGRPQGPPEPRGRRGRGAGRAGPDPLRHRPGPARAAAGRGALRRDLPLPAAGGRHAPRARRRRPAHPARGPGDHRRAGEPHPGPRAEPGHHRRGRPAPARRPGVVAAGRGRDGARRWCAPSTSTSAARRSR